jgi:hypothetical protein
MNMDRFITFIGVEKETPPIDIKDCRHARSGNWQQSIVIIILISTQKAIHKHSYCAVCHTSLNGHKSYREENAITVLHYYQGLSMIGSQSH